MATAEGEIADINEGVASMSEAETHGGPPGLKQKKRFWRRPNRLTRERWKKWHHSQEKRADDFWKDARNGLFRIILTAWAESTGIKTRLVSRRSVTERYVDKAIMLDAFYKWSLFLAMQKDLRAAEMFAFIAL